MVFKHYQDVVEHLYARHPVFYHASINPLQGIIDLPEELTDLICSCDSKAVIQMTYHHKQGVEPLIAIYKEYYEKLVQYPGTDQVVLAQATLRDMAKGMLEVMRLLGHEVPMRIPELGNLVRLIVP